MSSNKNSSDPQSSTSEQAKAPNKCRAVLSKILDHWSTTALMTTLTIYALFGDDLRLVATSKSADDVFYSLSTACLFFFTLEISLGCIAKEGYFLSFFFWLDVVATISLIPDIGWIWDPLLTSITGSDDSSGSDAADASQIARAGRASRAGTRAGRIIRILRVIRLIRIVKLYKLSQEANVNQRNERNKDLKRGQVEFRGNEQPLNLKAPPVSSLQPVLDDASVSLSFDSTPMPTMVNTDGLQMKKLGEEEEDRDMPEVALQEESKVGKRLSELTTRRVIMLVLGMMFGLPLFYTTLYLDINTSYQFGLETINLFVDPGKETEFDLAWDAYINDHKDLETPLIYLEVENKRTYETDTDPDDLRSSEIEQVTLEDVDSDYEYISLAVFDLRFYTRLEAGLNMIRTVFVCIVLAISSIFFSKDAQNLILGPIENMIQKVKSISKNPLKAAQEEEREAYTKQLILKDNTSPEETKNKEKMETHVLESTLTKIGALLALGFGEAGSEIIASNMQKGGGDVDPMIPGKTVHCIFGFCDIRNFTDTTEVLQQEVMRFVNEIALVVHSVVDNFSGNANKNIGDAFLLVWKFPEECTINTPSGLILGTDPYINVLADMSIISFLKIIAEIYTNPKIAKYKDHPILLQSMPGYSVKMGFGLHQGWAIEGAIGSNYKIDASYLSPNVNMASRLEAATKQFGVPLLISDALYDICSEPLQDQMRRIDKVTVKGSVKPIELYTCDVDPSGLQVRASTTELEKTDMKKARVLARIKRDHLREEASLGKIQISDILQEDEDLKKMRESISDEFLREFANGLESYLDGNWTKAEAFLNNAEALKGSIDGPTQTLLEFIRDNEPDNWPGYRELHEK